MSQQKKPRVAVVGAGASGLPAIRHALLYDLEPVCFERSDAIGGLWKYKPHETDESSVMKSTVINTSKEMTAYSDFPPPPEFANFMHNRKMLNYFEMYAEHFNLNQHIYLNHTVTNVERSQTFDKDGTWIVHFVDQNNCTKSEIFECVLLCTGHHTEPYFPEKWPGQENFKGKIIHAHSYKDHRGYEDKVVTVVGVGNSGFDIAVELSRIASQIYVSTRRGTWIFNRLREYGIPYDIITFTRFIQFLSNYLPTSFANSVLETMLQARFDHARYGLKPDHRPLSAHPTVNDELPNRLACGSIIVKPNIQSFTENGLIFDDGSSVDNIDEVILSTGYSFGFPLAEGGKLIPVHDNHVSLYKLMYPVETTNKHNSLAVIGLIQPLGSIMPISELQARFFFDAFVGHTELPSKLEMETEIRIRRDKMEHRYIQSRRHTIQVDYNVYMDELAEMMGCLPQPEKYLLTDPKLALKMFFGGNMPYNYRLTGPHAWAGARDALMDSDKRILAGTSQRKVDPINNLIPILWLFGCMFLSIGLFVKLLL
ncbi:Dimethylaniline monooxygenase [N-oxide-forming] [Aphelenchoides bicaudatus]|nr:Dimethylaniline monooxygenase [N-oxide-forming] [Aphelenchoides bicaudatus]